MSSTTPFLFFEFDSSLFQKYYGSGINTPGIYAIPEDETEPSAPPEEEQQYIPNPAAEEEDESGITQRYKNMGNISAAMGSQQEIPLPQMSADEQQAYEQEIQPIKKVFLLNKLKKLQKVLQDNSMSDDDLNIVLTYGPYLTYNTLLRLAITSINNLKNNVKEGLSNNNQPEEDTTSSLENQVSLNMVPIQGADVNVATQQ